MNDISLSPEGYEVKAALDSLQAAHAAFTETEAKAADPLVNETLDKLSAEVGRLQSRVDLIHRTSQRPARSGGGVMIDEHKAAFVERYLRKGQDTGLETLEAKSLNITTPAEGGFAVPPEIDQMIETRLKDISPIRQIANVVQVGSALFKKLVATSGFASGWVSEVAARPETTTPQFAEIAPPWGELYANPAVSQAMLDDAIFNVEEWLAGEIAVEFAKQEGTAFITGHGTAKPKGFLTYTTAATADGVRAFGTLQHVASGTAGAFPASNPADKLVDLVQALRPAYRQGAVFVTNSKTLAVIRKFKDAQGAFLWQPSMIIGQPATLLGYPVIEA
jgi:HK97 family phage major capsid protein